MVDKSNKIYWFLEKDPKDVVEKLDQFNQSGTTWSSNPILQAWCRNSIAYFSNVLEPAAWDSSLVFTGEQGELVKMVVPQARSMIRQLVSIITKQRLAFNAIAQSSDTDVINATKLANAICAEVTTNKDLDRKYELAIEQALVLGSGYLKTAWRTDMGRPWARGENDELLYEGDVEISTPSIWDVFYDFGVAHWEDLDWVQVRTIKNRYNLVAQFPEMEDEILMIPSIREWRGPYRVDYNAVNYNDYIFCYELYHKPTPALPSGRMIFFSDPNTIYHDGVNLYEKLPVEQIKPEVVFNTGWGCPLFSSLLPAQEMYDTMLSSIATNNSAFAVQNIAVPRGAALTVQDIKGMNFFSYTPMQGVPGGGKPEAIQLTQSSPETFKFSDILKNTMQELSMINAALRGEPPPQVSSGTAIATLTSTALESINAYGKSGRKALENTMYNCIDFTRRFAKIPRMVRLVGRNYEAQDKEYIGKDLDPIRSVKITESNPLMQTLSGRVEIAKDVMSTGLVKDLQSYFAILDGAPPRELYEDELSEEDLIRKENESLIDGEPVIALNSDDHPLHISKHKCLLNSPKVRFNAEYTQRVLNHILEHYELAKTQDPMLAGMMQTGKMPEGGMQMQPPPLPPQGPAPSALGEEPDNQATAVPANPADDLLGRR